MSAVRAIRFDELADGEARRVDVEGARLCVVRIGDRVYAIGDRCTPRRRVAQRGRGRPRRVHHRVPQARQRVLARDGRGAVVAGGEGRRRSTTWSWSDGEVVDPDRRRGSQPTEGGTVSELVISDLHASVGGREILFGVNLTVRSGEVHAVMGPNGSGKSTLSHVLMGKPGYEVTGGSVTLDGVDLLALDTVGARSGRPVPRDAVPDRGAGRDGRAGAARGHRRGRWRRRRHGSAAHRRRRQRRPRPGVIAAIAQRRLLGRREEAQRDRAARGARARASRSSTRSTPASTSTRCARSRSASRRPPRTAGSGCWRSPTTTGCSRSCTPTWCTSSPGAGSSRRAARRWRRASRSRATARSPTRRGLFTGDEDIEATAANRRGPGSVRRSLGVEQRGAIREQRSHRAELAGHVRTHRGVPVLGDAVGLDLCQSRSPGRRPVPSRSWRR